MNQKQDLARRCPLGDPGTRRRLLSELDLLFSEIEDGTVKDSTFIGCIALGHKNLPPVNRTQSEQIKTVLSRAPASLDESTKGRIPILSSVFDLIRSFLGGQETQAQSAQDGTVPTAGLLDRYGRVKGKETSQNERDENTSPEPVEIQEGDVAQFCAAQGKDYAWVLPYAWDLANRLNAVKKSEAEGDLALFFESRRKLCVRRPKSTRFEQSVQRYAAEISTLCCDEKGDVIDEKALEAFIGDLVAALLDKTRRYWVTSPLLAIFDGVVAAVIRPLLHKHQTAYYQSETTGDDGVIVSGSSKGKKVELATAPAWNEKSRKLAARFVKKAFKAQVWSFFLDSFAPYNREYARSPHLDSAALTNAGYLVRSFGDPVHLKQVMDLLQPTSQADELVQYVVEHFRDEEFIDH